ncbi:MAG: alkaline phosphatase family protein, partial [Candidatus Latescibacterota bacterium]
AAAALLIWPVRWGVRSLVRGRRLAGRRLQRVVVLGLDGLDPGLAERYMAQGLLPNLDGLRRRGCFDRLATTVPAVSPVAWSSFLTGCNPGKHRIYDFLVPDRRRLRPRLAAGHVEASPRGVRIGPWRIPLGRPVVRGGRGSRPFWHVLGDHGIPSAVLRVPLTFPPEPFDGVLLAAMCVPDLRGTQGTYLYFTTREDDRPELRSGLRLPLRWHEGSACGVLPGPRHPLRADRGELTLPFRVCPTGEEAALLALGRRRVELRRGEHSAWVPLAFPTGLGLQVRGLCRFLLLESWPQVRLYVTPLQIDPAHPALPISHPLVYSVYLAREQGPFATLGLAEDTGALNEGILSEAAFLAQCRQVHAEREAMLFDALRHTPHGMVACVFDGADRVQHMLWRGRESPADGDGQPGEAVREAYVRMDGLVGRVRRRLDEQSALIVLSDHGFTGFRRTLDLNAWLRERGYLAVTADAGADMLEAVDWSRARAYAVGFGGIYLNLRGREARGVVAPGEEATALARQIAAELLEVRDGHARPVSHVFRAAEVYRGPYAHEAPDLVVGLQPGYRVAWRTLTGGVGPCVFEDNPRPWSGDHSVDPAQVPGVLFCDRALAARQPHITDVAPTILDLLGVPVPPYMDGRSLVDGKRDEA